MKNSGYTLVEIHLVVALIGAISAFSLPVYQTFFVKNGLESAVNDTANSLRRAQLLSQAGTEDSEWGVKIEENRLVIFKGSSFASRDAAFDEITNFSATFDVSGNFEMVYEKISGLPKNPGSLNLVSSGGETRTISVNLKGMIEY
jgi:type II secretory pathway pseudopilin PulG